MSAGLDAGTRAPGRAPVGAVAWAQAAALVAVGAVMYHRTAAGLWETWTTNDNYSHGPLVPLTSAALVWLRWDKLRALAPRPDARGLWLVALGCVMQVVGTRADLFAVQGWSLLPLLFGLSLTFFGRAVTHMLAFPLGYLAFMLTFPPIVMNTLSYALKELAVAASLKIAAFAGTHVRRDGMSLFLPTGELRVENPCSGLRSLVALVATGTLFAYFQRGGAWRRIAVLLAAVPIALAGNIARLATIVILADRTSVAQATGRFHDASGYVLYAVSLALLWSLRGLLTPREGPR
ncbi:MAG: exosortase/archaeosortase family protein [Candidatus Eisenbacteria bacterium]